MLFLRAGAKELWITLKKLDAGMTEKMSSLGSRCNEVSADHAKKKMGVMQTL